MFHGALGTTIWSHNERRNGSDSISAHIDTTPDDQRIGHRLLQSSHESFPLGTDASLLPPFPLQSLAQEIFHARCHEAAGRGSVSFRVFDCCGGADSRRRCDEPSEPGPRVPARAALQYEMTGSNHGWTYQFHAESTAKKDSDGGWFEEIAWSNLRSNAPMKMSAESEAFRQKLSLSGDQKYLAVPDLSTVQPFLIGPITDTLTFYADLFLAKKLKLAQVGQHAYFETGTPNSWADGTQVIVGEDVIDFDLTLVSANPNDHTAELLVKHVPPKQQRLKLQTSWMEIPVRTLPNNWLMERSSKQKFTILWFMWNAHARMRR
jgi:hypothetical protein